MKDLENDSQSQDQFSPSEDIMDKDEKLLKVMKERIVRSYKWHEDVVLPMAEELKTTPEVFEEILMKHLDMSSLEALHARFESAKFNCTREKVHSDLRLCWLTDVMEIVTEEETEEIEIRITSEVVYNGKNYDEAIEDGRKELLEFLMR
jgi:energy-converting hydrogenase A subunit M